MKTNWDKVYKESSISGGWLYLSKLIIKTFIHESGPVKSKSIIEAGSGSGKNSFRLAKKGANITLLDISEIALEKAKKYYKKKDIQANFIIGDIFNIPLEANKFDIVWNAGVIEHWTGENQVKCLSEMLRITSSDGLLITLNPNSFSFLHQWGKKVFSFFKFYRYPDEINIKTLEYQSQKAGGMLLKKEYSIGFFVLFIGFFLQLSYIPYLGIIFYIIFQIGNILFSVLDSLPFFGNIMYRLDKFLSKWLGGYLLVSVIKKNS